MKFTLRNLIWVGVITLERGHMMAAANIRTPWTASPVLSESTPTSLSTISTTSSTISTISIPPLSSNPTPLPLFVPPKDLAPPNPAITPAPAPVFDENGEIQIPTAHVKWHLTTYFTCLPRGKTSNCGWHEPVLPGGTEIAAANSKFGDIDGRWLLGIKLGIGMGVSILVGFLW